eukprot:3571839-Heterocapsa_arctica.AAC.1
MYYVRPGGQTVGPGGQPGQETSRGSQGSQAAPPSSVRAFMWGGRQHRMGHDRPKRARPYMIK